MAKKVTALNLSIFDNFQCIGGKCVQTCCSDWLIDLYEHEYDKIIRNYRPHGKIEDYFGERERNGIKKKYIKLKDNGDCPFLDENRWCNIQNMCGADTLSKTCRVFPRIISSFGAVLFEGSLSTGCERVVQMLFEEKDGLLFDEKELTPDEITVYENSVNSIVTKENIDHRFLLSYWFDFKVLGLSVLMDRNYTIEERILLLGIAFKKLDELEKNHRFFEVRPYINSFLENIKDGKLKKDLAGFTRKENLKVRCAISLASIFLYNSKGGNEIISVLKEKLGFSLRESYVSEGSGGDTVKINGEIHVIPTYDEDAYNQCLNYYTDFIQDKEYFLENFMTANYLMMQAPFMDREKGLLENYKVFAAFFVMYKFCMTVYMDETKSNQDLINMSVILSRKITHALNAADKTKDILKALNAESIAHIAILLL